MDLAPVATFFFDQGLTGMIIVVLAWVVRYLLGKIDAANARADAAVAQTISIIQASANMQVDMNREMIKTMEAGTRALEIITAEIRRSDHV